MMRRVNIEEIPLTYHLVASGDVREERLWNADE